mgnify:CR=1 FL=1
MMSESIRGPSYTMLIGLFLAAAVLIVYLLAPVLSPFFLSGIVAYLGQPIVHFLECRKLSRGFGVLTFFLILIPVSYTHLTLRTTTSLYPSVVTVQLTKKAT